MIHAHAGQTYRGRPWWRRNQNPRVGQEYRVQDPAPKPPKVKPIKPKTDPSKPEGGQPTDDNAPEKDDNDF